MPIILQILPSDTREIEESREVWVASCTSRVGVFGSLRASRWQRVASRRLTFGRICVRGEELNCNFEGLARTPGFSCVEWSSARNLQSFGCGWPFSRKTSRLGLSGAATPSSLAEGVRPTRWFLDPAQQAAIGRAKARMRICLSPRIPRLRGRVYNGGNCV